MKCSEDDGSSMPSETELKFSPINLIKAILDNVPKEIDQIDAKIKKLDDTKESMLRRRKTLVAMLNCAETHEHIEGEVRNGNRTI